MELSTLNQEWDDEKLFYETRRIVMAVNQNLIYNWWLPLYIGIHMFSQYNVSFF